MVSINAIVVTCNLVILITTMVKFPAQQTISNILTLHLFFSRVGYSLISQTLRVHSNYCKSYNYLDCYLTISSIKLFIYEGSMCIILISIERYIKITRVRFYNQYFTRRNIIMVLLATWTISIGFPFFFETKWLYISNASSAILLHYCKFSTVSSKIFPLFPIFFILLLPPILMGILYVLLYKFIQHRLMVNVASNATINSLPKKGMKGYPSPDLKTQQNFNFQVKTAFHAMTMCSIYVIFLYPVFVVTFIDTFLHSFRKEFRFKLPFKIFFVTYSLQTIYPMIESFLYLYLNTNLWSDVCKLFSFDKSAKSSSGSQFINSSSNF